jgi:hypothetical protein
MLFHASCFKSCLCFRLKLHLEPGSTRRNSEDSRTASDLSCFGVNCSRWSSWSTGDGKSGRNRRISLPGPRSGSIGTMARGFRLAARGRLHRFRSSIGGEQPFGDAHKNWMVNFRVRDLDKMSPSYEPSESRSTLIPKSYPNGRFAGLDDPEGNPIQLWQPAKLAAPR